MSGLTNGEVPVFIHDERQRRLVRLAPDYSIANDGPPEREDHHDFEQHGHPTHDEGTVNGNKNYQAEFEGYRDETEYGVRPVLKGAPLDPRRRLDVSVPESIQHGALLLARATLVHVKLHE